MASKKSQKIETSPASILEADPILVVLKKQGELTTAQVASHLGITGEGARQKLVQLSEEGLVQQRPENIGRGRPLQIWQLTALAQKWFPDSHAELTVQVLDSLKKQLGDKALDMLITDREKKILDHYKTLLKEKKTLRDKVIKLAEIRNQEGYMASYQQSGNQLLLIESHCPICEAAKTCPGFCNSELKIFQKLLGPDVSVTRSEHLLSEGHRCVYTIEKKT